MFRIELYDYNRWASPHHMGTVRVPVQTIGKSVPSMYIEIFKKEKKKKIFKKKIFKKSAKQKDIDPIENLQDENLDEEEEEEEDGSGFSDEDQESSNGEEITKEIDEDVREEEGGGREEEEEEENIFSEGEKKGDNLSKDAGMEDEVVPESNSLQSEQEESIKSSLDDKQNTLDHDSIQDNEIEQETVIPPVQKRGSILSFFFPKKLKDLNIRREVHVIF